MEILADSFLKLLVDILGSADEPHRSHSKASLFHDFCGSLYKARVIREAKIVVGTEIKDFFPSYLNGGRLGTLYQALFFVEACFSNLSESFAEMLFHFSVHWVRIFYRSEN